MENPKGEPMVSVAGVLTAIDEQNKLLAGWSPGLYRHLVDSIKDYAVVMINPEGMVVSWNEGAERITGYRAVEILGRSFTRFYPPEAIEKGYPQWELGEATRTGHFEDEGWRVRKDGTRFWANVVIASLYDSEGNLLGFSKVTRDLTERRRTEEQARRLAAEEAAHAEAARRGEELARALADTEMAREAAQRAAAETSAAYRELDQFAYVASHDLKAPLRGIANLAQWIQDDLGEDIDESTREHLQLLKGRVNRMEALIDGILTYSRAGRAFAQPETVEIGPLVAEVIELLDPTDAVTLEIPSDLPVIEAERVPLQQVFMNLIGNAIKYTAAHRTDARIALKWRDLGNEFEFSICDNGPGIPAEFHERIWGIFQTLAARDKVEGTGIGLSVVKKIVEARGGRVWLESAAEQGATFAFTWPKSFHRRSDR
jgi:PAS domain S-box-containing protein